MSEYHVKNPFPAGKVVESIEYKIHFSEPGSLQSGTIVLSGVLGTDLEASAKALLALLVHNGWSSNPIMTREVRTIEFKSYHAEKVKGS